MRLVLIGTIVALSLAGPAAAQSLADAARQEETRRKAVKAPSKVYTNDNLRPSDQPAPPAGTPAPAAPAPAASATPAAPTPGAAAADTSAPPSATKPEAPRDEKYWRGRIEAARAAVARAQTFQDALQSRINALSTDFVNRDDPAQRNQIAADRQKALAELDRVKKEIADGQKSIAAIQDEARRANVPAGWVR